VLMPPARGLGHALRDRLRKAASPANWAESCRCAA